MIRYRGNKTLKAVRQLDAFAKIPEKYTRTSRIGGALSLMSRILIILLIYNEVHYYMDSKFIFTFKPDTDMDTKLKINIDLTIASQCRSIGADILDSTNQNIFAFGILQEDDTWFELDAEQRDYFEYIQHVNQHLRESYHSLAEILYKGNHKPSYDVPERSNKPNKPYDACRLHGTLTLNKVSGNFHITGGRSLHLPGGHIHINSLFDDFQSNFSHRINRFSFGDPTGGLIHPLEGDEKILDDPNTKMQYFIEVVPTDVETLMSHTKTFQYSVKENSRPIDHDSGSHGIPGLYFKYDMSALKVIVKQDREPFVQFIVRLGSIIAGIVVMFGHLKAFIQLNYDVVISKFGKDDRSDHSNIENVAKVATATTFDTTKSSQNLLLNNNVPDIIPFGFNDNYQFNKEQTTNLLRN